MDTLATLLGDLKGLVDGFPLAVAICEAPSGRILLYNRRAVELWGSEPGAGEPNAPFPSEVSTHAAMAEVFRTGEARDDEIVVERSDGTRRPVRISIGPVRGPDERVVGAISVFQVADWDGAERRQAEVEAAHLSAIVANADDAIVSKSLDGTITSWNRGAERLFGYAADEAVGHPITLIIPPERLHEESVILARLRAGETTDHFETERIAKDGRRIPISLTISPIRDRSGRIIGASKVARDISERRSTQERLTSYVATLEVLYRLADQISRARAIAEVCEAAVDAIMTAQGADRASVLVFEDAGVARFKAWRGLSEGYRAAVEGHTPWPAGATNAAPILIPDVLADRSLGALRDVVIGEGIRALGFVPLVYHGRLLGKFMVYYDAPHPFPAEEMMMTATIASHVAFGLARAQAEAAIEDLLVREQAARQEADAARANAERASQAKDEFLAMLAHELRNPLNVVANASAIIEGTPGLPTQAQRVSAVIRRQTQHLGRLLNDLLDVARITGGRIELERERVDLRAATALGVDALRHGIDRKRQQLALSLPARSPAVIGDLVRLRQVLENLVGNASKYTPAGGSIWVALAEEDREAVLRVRDDGVGIAPDQLDAIFDLFTQANPTLARTEGGLGIGLTLVKRIVELHGGGIRAYSEGPGHGAEFVVRLPLAAPPLAAAAPPPPPAITPRRVLVVEDHDDGREMLAAMLRLHGHEVVRAATGAEGVELATRHAPDVVLVDIGLPDVSGYEVGRRLREKLGPGIRLVALTGYGQPQDRARSAGAGFDDHLVKPIDAVALNEVLERLA